MLNTIDLLIIAVIRKHRKSVEEANLTISVKPKAIYDHYTCHIIPKISDERERESYMLSYSGFMSRLSRLRGNDYVLVDGGGLYVPYPTWTMFEEIISLLHEQSDFELPPSGAEAVLDPSLSSNEEILKEMQDVILKSGLVSDKPKAILIAEKIHRRWDPHASPSKQSNILEDVLIGEIFGDWDQIKTDKQKKQYEELRDEMQGILRSEL